MVFRLTCIVASLYVIGSAGAAAPLVKLAGQPIVISKGASAPQRATARKLGEFLKEITRVQFAMEEGDGARGIVVGRPGDFAKLPFKLEFEAGPFAREQYLLRTTDNALYLLGASDLA